MFPPGSVAGNDFPSGMASLSNGTDVEKLRSAGLKRRGIPRQWMDGNDSNLLSVCIDDSREQTSDVARMLLYGMV